MSFVINHEWGPLPWTKGLVNIEAFLEGELEVKFSSPDALKKFKLQANTSGDLSLGFEKRLQEGLTAKLSMSSTLKVGFLYESKIIPSFETGFQAKPNFWHVSFPLRKLTIEPAEILGVQMSMEFNGKVRLEVGPSGGLLVKLEKYIAPAATEAGLAIVGEAAVATAAVAGALVVATVIIGGTIYSVAAAKAESVQKCTLFAARDAFASGAARETCSKSTRDAFPIRIRQWQAMPEPDVGGAAVAGVRQFERALAEKSEEERNALIARWRTDYAGLGSSLDFNSVREKMFWKLGGLSARDSKPTLEAL